VIEIALPGRPIAVELRWMCARRVPGLKTNPVDLDCFESGQRCGRFVFAGVEGRNRESAGAVGNSLIRNAGSDIPDDHRHAGDDAAAAVLDDAGERRGGGAPLSKSGRVEHREDHHYPQPCAFA